LILEFVPFNTEHIKQIRNKISGFIIEWAIDWCGKNASMTPPQIILRPLELNSLKTIKKENTFSWAKESCEEIEDYIGYRISKKFNDSLLKSVSGCEPKEFNNSQVNRRRLVHKIFFDFINYLTNANLEPINKDDKLLKNIQKGMGSRHTPFFWEITVKYFGATFMLIVSSRCLKFVLFGQPCGAVTETLLNREDAIKNANIKMKILVDDLRLTFEDFSSLQVGDVLTNRKKMSEQLKLQIEGLPMDKISVTLGKHDNSLALKLA